MEIELFVGGFSMYCVIQRAVWFFITNTLRYSSELFISTSVIILTFVCYLNAVETFLVLPFHVARWKNHVIYISVPER
jgi:hypothetical protein